LGHGVHAALARSESLAASGQLIRWYPLGQSATSRCCTASAIRRDGGHWRQANTLLLMFGYWLVAKNTRALFPALRDLALTGIAVNVHSQLKVGNSVDQSTACR
jgi:hypothetical protein